MYQDGPQKVQEAASYVFSRAGEAPERRFARVFTCQRGPRRAPEANSYVFLHVFLESHSGPRRAHAAAPDVFLRAFLARGPSHTCFYVSAVVSRRVGAV